MFSAALKFSILALALPLSVLAASHGHLLNRRHAELAKRSEANVTLDRRVSGARFSYYDTQTGNAGSCGSFLSNSGFTVALNAAQMNSGYCYKQVTMSYNGKTTTATIEDTCPGCPWGGMDLTPALFEFFAPQSMGIIYGEWELAGAAPAAAPAPAAYTPPAYTPPATTTTPQAYTPPAPTTTSVYVAPKPTSTYSPKPSSSAVYSYSSKHSSVASAASSTPSATSDNLEGLYRGFIGLGGLVLTGNSLSS